MLKEGDGNVTETDSNYVLPQSHSSMGPIKTIGESSLGPLRMSHYGTYSRVVMVAIDASPGAKYAFNWYLKHIWSREDLVLLAHVPETPYLANLSFKKGAPTLPTEDWVKTMKNLNEKTRKLQEEYEVDCVKRKIKFKFVGETAKNPGEELCRVATDEEADMIVIGSRGLSALKRAMIGSVSEYVVRNSGMPCIVVHQKKLIA